jgi:ketosteroid isomerase-like protein
VIDRYAAEGHHRFTIDPAAENGRAIRAYASLGFWPVGVLRRYERGPDGDWRDALLMDLVLGEDHDPSPIEVIRRYLALAQAGDWETAFGIYADNVEMHVPGQSKWAGTLRGVAAARAYIDEARSRAGAVEIELVETLTGGDRVALVLRERFASDGDTVEIRRVNVYTVRAGRITEIWIYDHDVAAIDALMS